MPIVILSGASGGIRTYRGSAESRLAIRAPAIA